MKVIRAFDETIKTTLFNGLREIEVREDSTQILKFRGLASDESWMEYHFAVLFLTAICLRAFGECQYKEVTVLLGDNEEENNWAFQFSIGKPLKTFSQIGLWALRGAQLAVTGACTAFKPKRMSRKMLTQTSVVILPSESLRS